MYTVAQETRTPAMPAEVTRIVQSSAQIFVLIGPPGCGKGTQARILTQKLGIPAISTGDLLRDEAAKGTALGRKVLAIMQSGELVGDDLVNEVVASRIAERDCVEGFILDGYPRTVAQGEYLGSLLAARKLSRPDVLVFDVLPDTLVARLTARRYCPVCGRIYNLVSAPPAEDEYCDDDGMCLVKRADDDEAVIRERIIAYQRATAPLLKFYAGRIRRIDASADMYDVAGQIEAFLPRLV